MSDKIDTIYKSKNSEMVFEKDLRKYLEDYDPWDYWRNQMMEEDYINVREDGEIELLKSIGEICERFTGFFEGQLFISINETGNVKHFLL